MQLILLSGGSGKRLWPLSNDVRSKQFLRVLEGRDNNLVSMVERVWGQLSTLGMAASTYLCASKLQKDLIHAQLGDDVSIIVEPMRMDTFPAIALAAAYLADQDEEDDILVVAPVDQFVETIYFERIKSLSGVLATSGADMVLLGVKPTHPSTQYGYICVHPEHTEGSPYARVSSFREKPERAHALELVEQGALWNCGVFCFRKSYLIRKLQERGLPTRYRDMVAAFHEMPKRSFDYEVVEQTQKIVVVPYEGAWKDLGTWETLAPEMRSSFLGIGVADACENSHIINELSIPIVAKGLKDVMVVASPDGILVTAKDQSSGIKDLVAPYCIRPMFEERRWGSYKVLDYQKLPDGTEVLTKQVTLRAGAHISYHRHHLREEVWTMIAGDADLALDGRMVSVTAGDVFRVCRGQWHSIMAKTQVIFIEVQRGETLTEEDCDRRYIEWEDVVEHCAVLER
ncbi:sugar phosphate nucleotidyltransferase [Ferroacidibacillus organovorans]|uniref:sugar phosphate nucleotidyltransferase n=1 Tax=Ferroacidibacillus organovorans TaxID=1765683 RepID=UPI000B1E5354|nr:sugar phosphate nucleotidyltransferase [Ferroacidibacillus organovorans]